MTAKSQAERMMVIFVGAGNGGKESDPAPPSVWGWVMFCSWCEEYRGKKLETYENYVSYRKVTVHFKYFNVCLKNPEDDGLSRVSRGPGQIERVPGQLD